MIGKKFGMCTVIEDSGKRTKDNGIIWVCRCDCGKIKNVSRKLLMNDDKPRSCGCSRKIRAKIQFESHFEKTDGCWIWKGCTNQGGYGKFGGRAGSASRVAYQFYVGPIPKNKQVCHKCDNRLCVNPEHLFLGSIGDNMKDRTAKNRQAKGSKIANSILNEQIVLEIRQKRLVGKEYQELADEYKIGWYLVRSICKNRQWKHVPLGEECKAYISKAGGYPYQRISG